MTKEQLQALVPGDKVKDHTGRVGDIVEINNVKCIKSTDRRGYVHYIFFSRANPEELEKC